MIEQLLEQNLTAEQAFTLALVRATAAPGDSKRGQAAARLAAAADPGALYRLLARQRLLVTLGAQLIDDPKGSWPQWFVTRVAASRTQARHRGLLHQALTERVAKAFAGEGIRLVPLKGAILAEALYGDLGARDSSDLDLLVAPEHLDRAVTLLKALGWLEHDFGEEPAGQLPVLHRELYHPGLPPVEVHWRVHWYEASFAREAFGRAAATDAGWLRLQPADELAFLLLFLARDGLTGLRQALDVAAWWGANGADPNVLTGVRAVAERNPALAPALRAAARFATEVADLPAGSGIDLSPTLSRAQMVAIRLANPWLVGSVEQIAAEVSLIDGLCSPRAGIGAFVRRQVVIPTNVILKRQPELLDASPLRVLAARAGHALRVIGRYGLAGRRVSAGRLRGRVPR